MADAGGHIKLARKFFENRAWLEQGRFSLASAWIDLIQMAAWKDTERLIGYQRIPVKRGELVASLRYLATRWGWGVQSVRTSITTLVESTQLQVQRETQSGTVYLIVNYDTYQSTPRAKSTAGSTPGNTAVTQHQHKEEAVKAVKAVTDVPCEQFEAAWAAYPKRPNNAKAKALRAWNARIREGVEPSALIAGVQAYAAYVRRTRTEPQFVKLAASFFGPDRHWETDYAIPRPASDHFARRGILRMPQAS